ncbi:hypothetical protein PVT68_03075 [Microbulbifer bruguierae]|uniref:Sulfotransferase domain-containing protein n=1 Tax=Microbulbifer bruguierae TaxID=3029061 RepID=A0ABY8NEE2_9GAMM|nr:hypothetical protein [Microbulbifer bruguierae]WGL17291.1 hypothetical protein PVT68_03075 [Microbulbifer bruguierae]
MKLLLHIGTEKTATTTIQGALFENRELLRDNGFHFLQCAGSRNNIKIPYYCVNDDKYDDYLRNQGILNINDKEKFKIRFKKKLNHEIERIPRNISTVIISSEHFHSRTNTAEEIQKVRNLLSEYFSEIRIICYLREQSSTCESLFSTAIKCGETKSLQEIIEDCTPANIYYNYYNMLSNWSNAFGLDNLSVRIFDRSSLINENIVDDFFHQIDFERRANLVINKNLNESITPFGQSLGRAINIAFPKYHNNGLVNSTRRKLMGIVSRECKGKGEKISNENYEKIYDSFSESNKALNEKFFGRSGNCFEHRPIKIQDQHTDNQLNDDNLKTLVSVFSVLSGQNFGLLGEYADLFRDTALEVQYIDIEKAYKLMELAQTIRPNGPLINKKLTEYKIKIKK